MAPAEPGEVGLQPIHLGLQQGLLLVKVLQALGQALLPLGEREIEKSSAEGIKAALQLSGNLPLE